MKRMCKAGLCIEEAPLLVRCYSKTTQIKKLKYEPESSLPWEGVSLHIFDEGWCEKLKGAPEVDHQGHVRGLLESRRRKIR